MSQAPIPYAPRDVANAPAIKQAIAQRSHSRGDAPAHRDWLLNHFYRHVIGNLQAPPEQLCRLDTLVQARERFAPQAVPAWVQARLSPQAAAGAAAGAAPMWWIAPAGAELLATEQRLLEFLQTRDASLQGKLMRINAPQALAQWQAEHARMAQRREDGLHEHQPEAVRLLWQGPQGAFYELLPASAHLRSEMAYESQHMRHCLGQFANRRQLQGGYGEHYAQACASGKMRLFSYRSGQQHPHITLSARVRPDGRLMLDQLKGQQNRPPVAKYRADVLAFLNSLPFASSQEETEAHPDTLALRIVHVASGWQALENVCDEADQLSLLQHQPDLLQHLPPGPPLMQWLLAARAPHALRGQPLPEALATTLAIGQAAQASPR